MEITITISQKPSRQEFEIPIVFLLKQKQHEIVDKMK